MAYYQSGDIQNVSKKSHNQSEKPHIYAFSKCIHAFTHFHRLPRNIFSYCFTEVGTKSAPSRQEVATPTCNVQKVGANTFPHLRIPTFKLIVPSVILRRSFGDVGSQSRLCGLYDPSLWLL